MNRRQLLKLASPALVGSLAGCSGNEADEPARNGGSGNGTQESETPTPNSDKSNTPTPETEEVDGIVGETVEKDGLAVTIEEVARGTETTDGVYARTALDNSQFIGYGIDVEVVGETSVEISLSNIAAAAYLGKGVPLSLGRFDEGMTVDGTALPSWDDSSGRNYSIDLFPGESASGGAVIQVPEESYRSVDQIIQYQGGTTVRFRGSDGQPRVYDPPTSRSGEFSFGEVANFQGVEYTVTGYTLTDRITTQTRTEEPESDAAQFIIISFEMTNTSSIGRSIFSRPDLMYADSEANAVGVAIRKFEANGQSFIGMYADQDTRDNNRTDGSVFYPGVTVEGSLAYQVPQQFDESNVSVEMRIATFTP
jgi:hypothetical protein